MGYAGWHGVTDKSGCLLCISYEPIEGTLACRFKSRPDPYIYLNVPENIYQVLLRSPFAGSYFRKNVRDKYPMMGEDVPSPYQPKEKPSAKNLKPVQYPNPQRDLFGTVIHG